MRESTGCSFCTGTVTVREHFYFLGIGWLNVNERFGTKFLEHSSSSKNNMTTTAGAVFFGCERHSDSATDAMEESLSTFEGFEGDMSAIRTYGTTMSIAVEVTKALLRVTTGDSNCLSERRCVENGGR